MGLKLVRTPRGCRDVNGSTHCRRCTAPLSTRATSGRWDGSLPNDSDLYACSVYAIRVYCAMIFVELTPFVAFCKEYWTDEDLRVMQNFLLVTPDAGDLIRGGAGLRKLRCGGTA